MVFAVTAAMAFQNAARRDNAHTFVVNRLAVEALQEPPTVLDTSQLSAHDPVTPSLYCIFRFIDQAARDTFYSDLVAQLAGAQGPTAGSWITKHDCGDYEVPPIPCVETEKRVF